MNVKLFMSAIIKYLLGVILVCSLIFIPAYSLNYINAWIFVGLLFIPMFIAGIILMIFNPKLLKERLNAREKENDQKTVIMLSAFMFISGFVISGLNYHYNWIHMPKIITTIGITLFILSYIMYGEILRENTYLSRTIKVEKGQRVVDKGFYRIVRHPMYLATIILFLSIPLILDSLISFLIFLIYPCIIIKRIKNEEKVLEKELKGYKEYKKKVKYRLFPFIY